MKALVLVAVVVAGCASGGPAGSALTEGEPDAGSAVKGYDGGTCPAVIETYDVCADEVAANCRTATQAVTNCTGATPTLRSGSYVNIPISCMRAACPEGSNPPSCGMVTGASQALTFNRCPPVSTPKPLPLGTSLFYATECVGKDGITLSGCTDVNGAVCLTACPSR